jgi:molybdopterin converting factor small subunit
MSGDATIKVHLPGPLRDYSGGTSVLSLSVKNVRAALELIERDYPALHRNICEETGAVRRHINLFVNKSHIRDLGGLDAELAPGDILTILPAVSGG